MIGSVWRTIGEYGRQAALLLAVAFVSLALSGEARANDSHHHHDHHAHAHHAAPDMAAGQSSDHGAQTDEHAHAHDGECHCLSASCAPVLMPAVPAQVAACVLAGGHDLPPAISADAQAVSGPPARPPRA